MNIRNLAFLIAAVVVLSSNSEILLAQMTISDLTEESISNRSNDDQRGRIESTVDDTEAVGPSAENIRETIEELRGTDRQRRRQDMRVENLNDRRNRRRRRARQTPPPPVHVQLQPRFEFYRPASAQVASGVEARLNRLLEMRNAGSVSVSVEQRVAVLRGNVPSEYEKGLLEKLVSIEPGISWVENQIEVGTSQQATAK